ncbi:MAG: GIN domain-containing protein [Sphingomonadaceae bacterium]
MQRIIQAAILATALCSGATTALADDVISSNRSVDARTVKVNLDGVISLKVKQGPAGLTLYGEPRYLDQVIVEQQGDTLHIGTNFKGVHFGRNELRAELTLPNLQELVSGGVGATDVSGFSGDKLRLALEGAGAVKLNAQYRNVTLKLGGVGAMNIALGDSDNVDLALRGAGHIEVTGHSKALHADLGGVGSLDARHLQADQIDVNMSGLGSASMYAKNSANLKLTGLGSATVYGNPANRNASARGLGSVRWH